MPEEQKERHWAVWRGKEVEGARVGLDTVFVATLPDGMDWDDLLTFLNGLNPQHILLGETIFDDYLGWQFAQKLADFDRVITFEMRPEQLQLCLSGQLDRSQLPHLQIILSLPAPKRDVLDQLRQGDTVRLTTEPLNVSWSLWDASHRCTPSRYADDEVLLYAAKDTGHPRVSLLMMHAARRATIA